MNLNKTLFGIFWAQVGILFTLIFITEGFAGGADAICHWLISKDAFDRPILFLDQWNKPIFTLLSAPFAQFGLIGMRLFGGLCALLAALLISQVRLGGSELRLLPGILLLLIPQLVMLSTSSMTEPLFAFFFAWVIHFISKARWNAVALISVLIPFVRQEGMLILVIVLAILIYFGKWRSIIRLFLGTIVLAVIGAVSTGDPFWIITSFPYSSDSSAIYGHGDLLHYANYTEEIFGYPIAIAGVIGLAFLLIAWVRKRKIAAGPEMALWFAALVSIGFFSAHSIAWWKGLSGSLGLIRVMACIGPGVALMAAYGIIGLADRMGIQRWTTRLSVLFFIAASVYQLDKITNLPTPLSPLEKTMKEIGQWLEVNPGAGVVHYSDPVLYYFASEHTNLQSPINKGPITLEMINAMATGDRIVWDAHFSPGEGRLPLDSLLLHPKLQEKRSFSPSSVVNIYRGGTYHARVFEVLEDAVTKEFGEMVRAFEDFDDGLAGDPIHASLGVDGSACGVAALGHHYVTIRDTLNRSDLDRIFKFSARVKVLAESGGSADFSFIASISEGGRIPLSRTQFNSFNRSENRCMARS